MILKFLLLTLWLTYPKVCVSYLILDIPTEFCILMVATQDLQLLSVGILLLCDVIIVVGMKSDSRRYHRSDRNDVESSQTTIRKCHPVVGLFATGGGLTVAPTVFLGMRIRIPMVIRQNNLSFNFQES